MESTENTFTVTLQSSLSPEELLSVPVIIVLCVIAYLIIVAIFWFVRKCLANQGMCKQCDLRCDCCLWIRDCCLGCGTCCEGCSVNGCLDSINCPRQKYYCIDLFCCRCLCPDDSPCLNCCDDMASGSCECCGCQLNFSMAAQTARSPRQQQPGYPMYPNVNQPLGGFNPPTYLTTVPHGSAMLPVGQPISGQSTYPSTPQGYAGQIPRLNVRN